MNDAPAWLLVASVGVVGVLHTIVPDHWLPITLIARQRGWSKAETAQAALQAGTGHVVSTLAIAVVVWLAGVGVAERFGGLVDTASSLALIAFGGWTAITAWRELRPPGGHHTHHHATHEHHHHDGHAHDHDVAWHDDPLYAPLRADASVLTRHAHAHRHGRGSVHVHWHDHYPATAHVLAADLALAPPLHAHRHKITARTALLLILGSSPMIEGVPAFFAAGKYGAGLIAVMAVVFAGSTIATYMLLCVTSTAGLQRVRLGAVERYGEVLSGAFIMLVGVAFGIWPVV